MRGCPLVAVSLVAWLLLAGCGGNSNSGVSETATVPTSPAAETATVRVETATPTDSATPTVRTNPEPSPSPTATPAPIVRTMQVYRVPPMGPPPYNTRPHDVAPAADGTVWFTAQGAGSLGLMRPDGSSVDVPLGSGSAPHGVIVGPDGAAWVTDGGLNAIVRVDAFDYERTYFPLPAGRENANLNTAAFDGNGILWFTGQSGIYGRLDPATGDMEVFDAPMGRGPYGITATPSGDIYYASLAGSHIAKVDIETGQATVIQPPTPNQGARRVWSDSRGRIWVSEWNSGQVSVYDPADESWQQWKLPGARPQTYSVYVDSDDQVWLTDFGANAIVRFDPETEEFESFPLEAPNAAVRQMLGNETEVWGAQSGDNSLVVIRKE